MTRHAPAAQSERRSATFAQPLIVHSHLRWDFVWQRPQQILSRLAAAGRVLFVEEPIFPDDIRRPRLALSAPHAGVTRAVPQFPARWREGPDALGVVRTLLHELVGPRGELAGEFDGAVQWFYTPMPAPEMLGAFDERGVVYDCMDELSQFRFAPTDLREREEILLASADVVFTGGYKLFEAKSRHHDSVHFFGCGVDAAHFGRARRSDTLVPDDVADLPRPVFGYFGVIDERIDYDLLGALAAARPDASLVMVGPVVKVDWGMLPQAPNIHWLGQRAYGQLPGYVKAFDVCLMPFALNEATEFINPTKTLEYMAAGKPIVSTPVADVVRNFTPVVRIARSADEFMAAVAEDAERPDPARIAQGIDRATGASWESIVAEMRRLIAQAIAERESSTVIAGRLPLAVSAAAASDVPRVAVAGEP